MTFKQWLQTKDAKRFKNAMEFDKLVVEAMEAAWNASQVNIWRLEYKEREKHAHWCSLRYCDCGVDK